MIIHYGYTDGSGKYYVSIDAEKCDGCGKCITVCPQKILALETLMVDLDDKVVSVVKEEFRKKIKYACDVCKKVEKYPCMGACELKAIEINIE